MEFVALLLFALLSQSGQAVPLANQPPAQSAAREQQLVSTSIPGEHFVPQLLTDSDPDEDSDALAELEPPSCCPLGSNAVPAHVNNRSAAEEAKHHELQELVRAIENHSRPLTPEVRHLLDHQYKVLLRETVELEVKALLDKSIKEALGSDVEGGPAAVGGASIPTQAKEVLAASEAATPQFGSPYDFDPTADSFEERESIRLLASVPADRMYCRMRASDLNAVGCFRFDLQNVDLRNMRRGRVMIRAEAVGQRGTVYVYHLSRSFGYPLQAVGRRGPVAMFEMSLGQIGALSHEQHMSEALKATERRVLREGQREHQNHGFNFTIFVGIRCGGPGDRCSTLAASRGTSQPVAPFFKMAVLDPVPLTIAEPPIAHRSSGTRASRVKRSSNHAVDNGCRVISAPINLTHLNTLIIHYRGLEQIKFCVGQCRSTESDHTRVSLNMIVSLMRKMSPGVYNGHLPEPVECCVPTEFEAPTQMWVVHPTTHTLIHMSVPLSVRACRCRSWGNGNGN